MGSNYNKQENGMGGNYPFSGQNPYFQAGQNPYPQVGGNPYIQAGQTPSSFSGFSSSSPLGGMRQGLGMEGSDFVKGALIGAAATFLLTNETAQKAIFKAFAKATSMMQIGVEELKERYEDAKAELEAEEDA